jgi:hypothetical protein
MPSSLKKPRAASSFDTSRNDSCPQPTSAQR